MIATPVTAAAACVPPRAKLSSRNIVPERARVVAPSQQRLNSVRRHRDASSSGSRVGTTFVLAASSSTQLATSETKENALLSVLGGAGDVWKSDEVKGRGAGATPAQEQAILKAIYDLESDGGLSGPVDLPEIEGEWSLIYTSKSRFDPRNPLGSRVDGTKPGIEGFFAAIFGKKPEAEAESAAPAVVASSSPIQRTITANESFTVTQDVALRGPNPHVDNVVVFGDFGVLRLTAEASVPVGGDRRRIDFAFDGGFVKLKALPVKIPYPVPFKLLGDEAKGWLDTTYLSPRVRISRGNKGTTFVLSKP